MQAKPAIDQWLAVIIDNIIGCGGGTNVAQFRLTTVWY